MRGWSWLLAAATCLGCALALPAIAAASYNPGWLSLGGLIGAGLGMIIVRSVAAGARVTVDADGTLTYYLGQRPNFSLPLGAVRDIRPIQAGLLRGIGCDCPLDQVHFHHRKGISLAAMQAQQQQLGVGVVLEHLDQAAQQARSWQRAIVCASVSLSHDRDCDWLNLLSRVLWLF